MAVRGVPIINDATLEDAEIAGIPEIAPVVANGSDAPGTLVEHCSEEFRYWFDRADLIIAKGQGNYECLSETDRNIFFLLAVKCPMVSADIGAPVGTLVVKQPPHEVQGSFHYGRDGARPSSAPAFVSPKMEGGRPLLPLAGHGVAGTSHANGKDKE